MSPEWAALVADYFATAKAVGDLRYNPDPRLGDAARPALDARVAKLAAPLLNPEPGREEYAISDAIRDAARVAKMALNAAIIAAWRAGDPAITAVPSRHGYEDRDGDIHWHVSYTLQVRTDAGQYQVPIPAET
jgi:hypothetical protein